MANPNGVISETTREDVVSNITSDFAYWRMNDATSTTMPNSGNILGDGTISGTLGTFWTANDPLASSTDYYVTFENSQYVRYATAAAREFMRLDTLGVGNILIAFNFFWTDNTPLSASYIVSHTMDGQAAGGWSVLVGTGNSLNVNFRDDSTITAYASINVAELSLSVNHHLLFDISPSNDYVNAYIDGVLSSNQGDLSGVTMPALVESGGLVVGGRSRTGNTPNDFITESESGILIGQFFMMRTTTDISSSVAALASEWAKRPYELPFGLEAF